MASKQLMFKKKSLGSARPNLCETYRSYQRPFNAASSWIPDTTTQVVYHPCMLYLPTFTIKINHSYRQIYNRPMDPSWVSSLPKEYLMAKMVLTCLAASWMMGAPHLGEVSQPTYARLRNHVCVSMFETTQTPQTKTLYHSNSGKQNS